jgi:hypothetical protein
MIMEELMAIISAAGITPTQGNLTQLLTALRSAGVFQNPGLFDNTTKVATTAFVQRALGSLAGFTSVNASTTLTSAQLGTHVQIAQVTPSGQTFTLPASATVIAGVGYWITNDSPYAQTVKANAVENINPVGNSFLLQSKETVFVFSQGTSSQWNLFGTIAALVFGASLGANGYQKLPGGLIMQWGQELLNGTTQVAVTFPIAFPTTVRSITTGAQNQGNGEVQTALTTG